MKKLIQVLEAILKELQALDWTAKNIKSLVLKVIVKAINEAKNEPDEPIKKVKASKEESMTFALVVNGANVGEKKIKNVQNMVAYNLHDKQVYKTASKEAVKEIDKLIKDLTSGKIEQIELSKIKKIVVVK